jgi:hypothetical protein
LKIIHRHRAAATFAAQARRLIWVNPNAFRKFKLAGNRWEDATPLGQVIVGAFTLGSSFVATLG